MISSNCIVGNSGLRILIDDCENVNFEFDVQDSIF